MKWTADDYMIGNKPRHLIDWKPPSLVYPASGIEQSALKHLRDAFTPLPPYRRRSDHKTGMEWHASENGTLVDINIPLPAGYIAFLENTAEKCTSPETKHSHEGMQRAKHWVQRIDTPDNVFRRLTDGYGISLMFGERFHQFIRNGNNWRGASGMMLDIDLFCDEKHPDAPEPVYSLDELLDRYPLLSQICTFIMPSASSLHDRRPFKARGIVLFDAPMTDQRVYHAFGDILLDEIDCIPQNVTNNPAAVGFGNTHNASQARYNPSPDNAWIAQAIEKAKQTVIAENTEKQEKARASASKKKAYQERKRNATPGENTPGSGENISTFIETCDPLAEMLRDGLLTSTGGTEYRWHESQHDRSCDILNGTIHIFSNTMSQASPAAALEPVNVHRFYLYQLCGLDMTRDTDKPRIREFLFQNGYGSDPKSFILKRNHKPVRLHKKPIVEYVLDPLKKSRKVLAEVFEKGKKFIGIRADTGVGKTERAENYYFNGYSGFFSTPTGDLAKEIYGRFKKRGIKAFLWRGVASNPDGKFPHEKPCEFAPEYIALVEKGRNPFKTLCDPCPFRAECDEHGYRSQETKAKEEDVVIAAHKDLLLNPSFRTTAKRLLPSHSDDLIVIDEFDILESFIEVSIPQSRLEYLRDTWYDHILGEFAKQLLDACVVQNAPFTGISHALELLSADERQAVIKALGQLRMGEVILDADIAEEHESATGQTSGLDNIQKLPILESHEHWNTLIKLELFFDVYKHAGTAPMAWKDNTLTFYLPPLPYYTRARVILMSATLNETFFRQVFKIREEKRGDVDFLDLENTEWHPDARVYQLRTNRNPRRTLLEGEKNEKGHWQYTPQLTQTGQAYLDKIKASIEKSDRKSGFIGHKTIIDNHTDDIDAATGHFGGLVGLNQHFYRDKDDGIRLHILGTPNIGQDALETACKLLLGMTESPLNFTRNDDGTFGDPNVQTVADAIVRAELTQAVGRAGLVKNPSEVIIWSSYELPSISHREQTLHFDDYDWERVDGDLDALSDTVAERQAHEQAVAEAVEKGDTKAVAELKGVSQGHARKITQEPKAKQRMGLARQVTKMIDSGMSQRAVEHELKISRKKITKLLHEYKAVQNAHAHVIVTHVDARNAPPPTPPDVTSVESETLHTGEVERDYDTFFKLLEISTCFYGKKQLSASDISQLTGIDESEVREILDDWYQKVVISPGVGDQYWMTERDKKQLWEKILGPAFDEWEQNFPEQNILCPPTAFNPHLNAIASESVGEAYLQNLLKKWESNDIPHVQKVDTEETMLTLFDWDIKTVYLRREEIASHADVSKLIPKDHRLRNIADDEVLRVDSDNDEITALSIVNISHILSYTEGVGPLGRGSAFHQ